MSCNSRGLLVFFFALTGEINRKMGEVIVKANGETFMGQKYSIVCVNGKESYLHGL